MADSKLSALTELAAAPADTDELYINDGGVSKKVTVANTRTAMVLPVLHVRDEKAANTSGGAASATTWHTRTLNTVVLNQITGASLATNQITLPAGTYRVTARAPMYRVDRHKIRLRNITDSTTTLVGSSAMTAEASTVGIVATDSTIRGRFTIAAEKVFELQHYAQSANANGLGLETNAAEIEIYAEVWIEKE